MIEILHFPPVQMSLRHFFSRIKGTFNYRTSTGIAQFSADKSRAFTWLNMLEINNDISITI